MTSFLNKKVLTAYPMGTRDCACEKINIFVKFVIVSNDGGACYVKNRKCFENL